MLRIRTQPEYHENNLGELTCDSNPNCGIARERGEKKKNNTANFPMKNSNLRHSLTGSQNKGLSKYQRRVSLLWIGLSPCWVQRGRQATSRAER